MRIVVDLQSAQSKNHKRGINSYSLSLAKALVQHRGEHEVLIALSNSFPDTIEPIRAEFNDLLSQNNIRVWYTPDSLEDASTGNDWFSDFPEKLREAFLASLKPDWLLIPSLLESASATTSIGLYTNKLPTAVLIHNISGLDGDVDSGARSIYQHQVNALRKAQLCFTTSKISLSEQAIHFGINVKKLKRLNITPENLINQEIDESAIQYLFKTLKESSSSSLSTCIEDSLPKERLKLAYVSPLPPLKTGIADYSAELLPELARYYDIDVIVEQVEVSNDWIKENCNIHNSKWLVEHQYEYDRVLYHMGNSQFHLHIFELLDRVPGSVVLHDVYLSGVSYTKGLKQVVPNPFEIDLFEEAGYLAIKNRYDWEDDARVVSEYTCNSSVIRMARGIILHSNYANKLLDTYHEVGLHRHVIPLLRAGLYDLDRKSTRKKLGLRPHDFVICSFGLLGETKQNQRLLNAWLNSSLASDKRCKLIFVGQNSTDMYGANLENKIRKQNLKNQVFITGWTTAEEFRLYLEAADLAVQLRTMSRGETSAAVLDTMNYGLPTIVNANGSMAELNSNAVWLLPDNFTDSELIQALEELRSNEGQRTSISNNARQIIHTTHNPGTCAKSYAAAIEDFYYKADISLDGVIENLSVSHALPTDKKILRDLAVCLDKNHPIYSPLRSLFIDVSATCRNDLKTGIERVARSILVQFINNPPIGYRVEPVYLSDKGGKWNYRYARAYTLDLLNLPTGWLEDDVIDVQPGDCFFAADLSGGMVVEAEKFGVYKRLKNSGVKIFFTVFDLLPIKLPDMFPPGSDATFEEWLATICRVADTILCISKSVANDLNKWHLNISPERYYPLNIGWFHLGGDLSASVPSKGIPKYSIKQLEIIRKKTTFLIVGTIEPRKGLLHIIEAFDQLWREGSDVNLVIVGREGWQGLPENYRRTIPQIVDCIRHHPEIDTRLFWLEGISDEYLDKIYDSSDCLIAASEDEGFGLPLIEAAQKSLAIFARDIPIFREVAGESAFYFSGQSSIDTAKSINKWIKLYIKGTHPQSSNMTWLTWRESVSQLSQLLCPGKVHREYGRTFGYLTSSDLMGNRKIYVDISVIYRDDFKTGIQRVTRSLLLHLLKEPPVGYEVIPVYIDCDSGLWLYKIAASYIDDIDTDLKFSEINKGRRIKPKSGDIFIGLDLAGGYVANAAEQCLYEKFRNHGARVYFVVYDLLPVTMPQFFSPADSKGHEDWLAATTQSDGVICISKAVAADYKDWLSRCECQPRPEFTIKSFSLGADIENSLPSFGLPDNAEAALEQIKMRPSFLQVGTIEPRKGYSQVLSAFELIWKQGLDANLIIVGKEGWHMEVLMTKLTKHPELAKHLFLMEAISDEYLETIYAASNCLIAASEGEGFGLPLIEAAQHGIPIIARDIPVFREVAGNHASYFKGLEAIDLAETIQNWLKLYEKDSHTKSDSMPWLTWSQSSKELIQKLHLYQGGACEFK